MKMTGVLKSTVALCLGASLHAISTSVYADETRTWNVERWTLFAKIGKIADYQKMS